VELLRAELAKLGAPEPRLLVLDGTGGGEALRAALDTENARPRAGAAPRGPPPRARHILYTSGSTGKPKGVTLARARRRS
jgi:long-subunit acyl-CoA synthetase (AMP-forming)